uniref:Uncharacterized protein n=1 Tax=Craspedostauros australis TaxID=1486917 RepID=A0A7R9ZJD9_9STRA|mmetsp:Transcript_14913/g.41325  ORF Transcript_14913/g.41325 Transcript_14913/m.41325 type:complete len:104 (+) Transcript_14913:396-707(+)|eukprot:CAMPEP_0198108230 /NCGR_PEP_ID=MMETSP1442-20131203/296_1 /TAXON_ID= /ORGANISM="Craspedostauros australis, Strain CCMP3328" /LENGTH=103 /DNA_ID=CAMNT_0043763459 /DNA_START=323 /DNA_END=634 /DNA_ORIENTATION=+
MIIDAKTVIMTLVIVVGATLYGLKFVRKFALQIAMENHDAIKAMDQEEETQRLKKQKAADAAAETAFAKVQPLLNVNAAPRSGNAPPAAAKTEEQPANAASNV